MGRLQVFAAVLWLCLGLYADPARGLSVLLICLIKSRSTKGLSENRVGGPLVGLWNGRFCAQPEAHKGTSYAMGSRFSDKP